MINVSRKHIAVALSLEKRHSRHKKIIRPIVNDTLRVRDSNENFKFLAYHTEETITAPDGCKTKPQWEQGHRLYGDQAARRPNILCSLCVHPSFWGFEDSCMLFKVSLHIPTNVFPNMLSWYFRRSSTVRLAAIWKGEFSPPPPVWWVRKNVGVWPHSINSPSAGSFLLTPHWHI